MASRKQTREYLLQYLYTEACMGELDRNLYDSAYFSGTDATSRDEAYFNAMHQLIHTHESALMSIITKIAPRFELATLPTIHILILAIALTEILYFS
jgi:transcription termination factor NusB